MHAINQGLNPLFKEERSYGDHLKKTFNPTDVDLKVFLFSAAV